MKKIFLAATSIFISLLSTPIFAQVLDPGDDPDLPTAPIDNYLWVLAAIGLIYFFLRQRAFTQQRNTPQE